jgi:2-octaprenyl-6-methoxyphenol hydroxylase
MLTNSGSYDVLIVGAGMVGASLALALVQDNPQPPRVLLVEASPITADSTAAQPGFDMRSTVLSAGSVDCFRQLGLWSGLQAQAEPITTIHVSDQGHFGTVRMRNTDEGVAALGQVVENAAMGRVFNAALLAAPTLEVCAPAAVTRLQPLPAGMQVQLQRDAETQTVAAALVVLAEGGRSGLCAQLGISHSCDSYAQSAVIANVAFTRPHGGCAYERFTPKGPLALLPLPDHAGQPRAALVWTHPEAAATDILALNDAEFLTALQRDFGQRVGTFTRVGKRQVFPLGLQVASEQARPGLVLLGNVAHTLHPVAGQGFNLALRDTFALAANIRSAVQQGLPPGTWTRLQAYLAEVAPDQHLTIRFSDYMTRLFSSNSMTLALLRKAGMASIDLLPPVKHALSRQAMGLAQPRVALS